jgi:hypothetical protein
MSSRFAAVGVGGRRGPRSSSTTSLTLLSDPAGRSDVGRRVLMDETLGVSSDNNERLRDVA